MDDYNLKDSDPSDFELDIELCKLINKIPIIGKSITDKICYGIDFSGELNSEFSKIVKIFIVIIVFLILLIFYFFFFEEPLNKLTRPDWGDAFDIGDFYRPVKKGKYICYQPRTELVDMPIDNIYDYPVPPPPPPPTINYGPSLI